MNKKSLIVLIIAISLMVACTTKAKKQFLETDEDNSVLTESLQEVSKIDNIEKLKFTEIDSSLIVRKGNYKINEFYVNYAVYENGDTISVFYDREEPFIIKHPDHSLFISINKEGEDFIIKRQFDKMDFDAIIPKNELKDYRITSVFPQDLAESSVFINVCKPDTDICYLLHFNFSDDGNYTIEEVEPIWDEEE